MNFNMGTLMNMLKQRNPKGYNDLNALKQNGGNIESYAKQVFGNMQPQQRQMILQNAKMMGAPDNVLSRFQNMK